jgi:hypothetical protein
MSKEFLKLEQECFEELGISEEDTFEARHNFLGFFEALHKINQRIQREEEEKQKGGDEND